MLVSGVQQSESLIHRSTLFYILFSFRLLQSIEFPVLTRRSLLLTVIYFIYSNVYVSVLVSKFLASSILFLGYF